MPVYIIAESLFGSSYLFLARNYAQNIVSIIFHKIRY